MAGFSGTGKTALASSILTRVQDDCRFVISGKFDADVQKPHTPFIAAAEEFTKQVQLRGDHVVKDMRYSINEAVGAILLEAVPRLGELLETDDDRMDSSEAEQSLADEDYTIAMSSENSGRFVSVFCRFIRAICGPNCPLILLLDDLQWANSSSLDILAALLDPTLVLIDGLMVLGIVRGNEVEKFDKLSIMLRAIEDNGTTITDIQVANLLVDSTAGMIANTLELSIGNAMPLAKIVHVQTGGNVFFRNNTFETY